MSDRSSNDENETQSGEASNPARRTLLVGSGAFIIGGVAGRASAARSDLPQKTQAVADAAPPLPWEWVKIDPMEAATRTYHGYLDQGG